MAMIQADFGTARTELEKSIAFSRQIGDQLGLAVALRELAFVDICQGDAAKAHLHGEESVSLSRAAGSKWDLAMSLHNLAYALSGQGDYGAAMTLFEESHTLYQLLQDPWGIANALAGMGYVTAQRGDYETARSHLEKAVLLRGVTEDRWSIAEALNLLGEVVQLQGELEQASTVHVKCLLLGHEIGNMAQMTLGLRHLAHIALMQRQDERAAHLYAAAQAIFDLNRGTLALTFTTPHDFQQQIEGLRTRLGDKDFAANWAIGEAMTRERVIEYALAAADAPKTEELPAQPQPVVPPPLPAGLTAREVEVLRLLAQGLSYAQIAGRLVISRRTVNAHLTSIYGKLGVTSRMAAARFASDNNLV
jgi:DNA-binding CsgD family transcriptional regulator/tetratricopeptide (TPR) repeat protein